MCEVAKIPNANLVNLVSTQFLHIVTSGFTVTNVICQKGPHSVIYFVVFSRR